MPNSRNHTSWGQGLRGKILQTGIMVVACLVGLRFARYALATTFRYYDDEGYILLSLKYYLAGGHLYSEVFSQYGPFYFFAQGAFFRLLHLPVNHDAGRLITLICWSLSALLSGYFVYKLSRSVTLGSAAGLACMSLAKVLADEPGHPQQIILPILMAASCAALFEGPISLLLLGAFGSLLFFIKINVGVFYFAAIAMTLVCRLPEGRVKKAGVGLLFAYAVGMPVLLMHRDLGSWARGYCLVAILCGVGTLLAGLRTTPVSPKPMKRVILYALVGAFSTAALIVLGTTLQGMSSGTLLDGVLWNPLKHPGVFELPFAVSKKTFSAVVLLFGCIGGLYWLCDRGKVSRKWIDALRCLSGLLVIALLTTHLSNDFFETFSPYAMALLPLGLLSPKGERWPQTDYLPRLFVTCLAATQFLQAYPVAGSQIYIGSSPLLLCAFIWIHDSAEGIFRLTTDFAKPFGDALSSESVLGGLVALALVVSMSWIYSKPTRRIRERRLSLRNAAGDRSLLCFGRFITSIGSCIKVSPASACESETSASFHPNTSIPSSQCLSSGITTPRLSSGPGSRSR